MWCGGQVTLGTAGRWSVALDRHVLHLELPAGVFGMAHVHVCGMKMSVLWKLLGISCWSQFSYYHCCTLLGFVNIHSSLIWVTLTAIAFIWHIATNGSDDTQYYIAINIILFKLLAILTQYQIPLRYTSDFPILLHHPPSAPRSLSKTNPTDGFAFAHGRTNIFFMCTTGILTPSTVCTNFDWAGPAHW